MTEHRHSEASEACSIDRRGFLGATAGVAVAASLGRGGEAIRRLPRRTANRQLFRNGSWDGRASRY